MAKKRLKHSEYVAMINAKELDNEKNNAEQTSYSDFKNKNKYILDVIDRVFLIFTALGTFSSLTGILNVATGLFLAGIIPYVMITRFLFDRSGFLSRIKDIAYVFSLFLSSSSFAYVLSKTVFYDSSRTPGFPEDLYSILICSLPAFFFLTLMGSPKNDEDVDGLKPKLYFTGLMFLILTLCDLYFMT